MTAVVVVLQLGVLKAYQLDRLGAFLDQQDSAQRVGYDVNPAKYNLNQSKIAIGSGGLTGKGLFKGSQTNLAYVHEQSTDFVFTVVGEELGLFGSTLLIGVIGDLPGGRASTGATIILEKCTGKGAASVHANSKGMVILPE